MTLIIKTVIIISFVLSVILFFPMVLTFIFLVEDRDLFLNYKKYKKKYVYVDSIQTTNTDGANTTWIYGYSKELNNYKTTIQFGEINNNRLSELLGMNDKGEIYRHVWYNKNNTKNAYPAEEKDSIYPINEKLEYRLIIPFIWILSAFTVCVFYKISAKRGLFNKKDKNL